MRKIFRREIKDQLVPTTLKLNKNHWIALRMAATREKVGAVTLIEEWIESLPEYKIAMNMDNGNKSDLLDESRSETS